MSDWYSYGPIDPSSIVRNPEKKHFIRENIEYSFGIKFVTSSSGSVPGILTTYQMTGEQGSHQNYVYKTLYTFSGTAPVTALASDIYLNVADQSGFPVLWYDSELEKYIRAYPPELAFGYAEKAVPVANASFTGGFFDWTKANTIKFGTDFIENLDEQYTVASGTFYIKRTSASSYSSRAFTGDSLTLAAGTLSGNKTYEAYADLVLDDGTTLTYQFSEITTTDSTGSCSCRTPKNEVTYGEIVFEWDYSIETGTKQKAYDLQVSADGSTWTTIKSHIVSEETRAEYSQATSGESYWRVRAYNQNDVAGNWSAPAYYINNIPPDAPTITSISGSGRQTVAWSASQQNAYQVQAVNSAGKIVYDTGEVYSTEKTALINEYLENDVYTFRVRVSTGIGGWSDWAETQKAISASLAAPSFTLTAMAQGVDVTIEQSAAYDHFYILRNGELIARTNSEILDHFVAGEAIYKVIGVNASDEYGYASDSISFTPQHNQIATEDGLVILVNKRWEERAFPERSISPKYASFEFLGENRPVHVFEKDFRKGTFTVAAFDENESFEDLLGKPVFFATTAGWGDWCVITSLNRREKIFGNDVSIAMELTAPPERIEYEN